MKAPIVITKQAFVSWGGRRRHYGDGDVQLGLGYTNFLGAIPYPDVHVRFGGRNSPGLTIGTNSIGISSRASDSLKERTGTRGLLDIGVAKLEDRAYKKKHPEYNVEWGNKHINDVSKITSHLREAITNAGGVKLDKGIVGDRAAEIYFPKRKYTIIDDKNTRTIMDNKWIKRKTKELEQ